MDYLQCANFAAVLGLYNDICKTLDVRQESKLEITADHAADLQGLVLGKLLQHAITFPHHGSQLFCMLARGSIRCLCACLLGLMGVSLLMVPARMHV